MVGLNAIITLKDMFSASMGKIGNSTNQQQKRLQKLNKEMQQLKSSMVSGTAGFMKAGLGLMGVSTALDSLSSIAGEAMGNYALQAKAEGQVLGSLRKSMDGMDASAVDAMSDSYKNLASELQGVGVIGDEVTLTGMAKMTNMGMNPEAVKAMTPYVQDLAVKLHGVDVNAENFAQTSQDVANAINKGSLKAFQNMGLQVTEAEQKQFKAMNTTERTAYLQQKLAKEVGGANKAIAETPAGKQAQAMNSYGDALEAVGKPLYELKGAIQGALIKPMNWLASAIPYAVTWFTDLADTIGGYFAPVLEMLGLDESAKEWEYWGDILGKVFNEIGFVIGVVVKAIAGTIAVVIGMFVALGKIVYTIINLIIDLFVWLYDGVSTYLGKAYDFIADTLSSIGQVFSDLGDMIGDAFTAVSSVIDTVVKIIVDTIDSLINTMMALGNVGHTIGGLLIDAFKWMYDEIVNCLINVYDFISDTISNVTQVITGVGKILQGFFTGDWATVWDGCLDVFTGVVNQIKLVWDNTVGWLIDGATNAVNKIKSIFSTASSEQSMAESKANNYTLGSGFATGTSYFKGGFTHINENNRGELVKLPNGSQVIPHDLSKQMLGGKTVNINVNVQGNVIGNDDFYNECGNAIYNHLRDALGNV